MSSVTYRINSITQPRGGYINPSEFDVINLKDEKILNNRENIQGRYIGLTVDYLTRFCMGTDRDNSFKISLKGASIAEDKGIIPNVQETAKVFLNAINVLDDESIINASKLTTFDVWYRNPRAALLLKL